MEDNKHYRPKKFVCTLLLIGVYKFKGEPVSQLGSISDGRPTFNKILQKLVFKKFSALYSFMVLLKENKADLNTH